MDHRAEIEWSVRMRQLKNLLTIPFLGLILLLAVAAQTELKGAEPSPTNALPATLDRQEVEFFEKKIRPVLVSQCYSCHSTGAKEVQGKLLLDSRVALLAGGETGPAIVVGDPKKSLLIQALRHEGLEMPPKKKLPAETIADFERWVSRGAIDPRVASAAAVPVKKEIDWSAARAFWSFQPITKPTPPTVKDTAWPRSDIDRFLLAKLEEQKLEPAADAERLTLLRRLSFDLTGLPPTPAEVAAFMSDTSGDATAKLVDRLLASPQFGEHWGRHWLDVARYAESNGNVDNFLFPHAWRYRDYVIAAINADKPLDRFMTEQVAGDLLPAADAQERNNLVTATGFLALTSKPRPQNNPDYALDLVAEQIEVTTTAFMGLTVACARCHDHKFDPIPQREYYSLAGIFESSRMLHGDGGNKNNNNKNVPKSGLHTLTSDKPAQASKDDKDKQLVAKVAELRKEETAARTELEQLIDGAKKEFFAAEGKALNNKIKNPQNVKQREKLLQRIEQNLNVEQKQRLNQLKGRLVKLEEQLHGGGNGEATGGFAMGMADADKPVTGRIRIRGETQKPGDTVPRGFVTVGSIGKPLEVSSTHSGRLELAQWITSPENPLTARVMANRIWRHLFGRGIVSTVDNFGTLGEKPTHPELLDHLATQLVANKWSLKSTIRSIVLSRAYQLSSAHDAHAMEIDPDNTLVWRHSLRRLEGESIRDSILLVAGELKLTPPTGSPVSKDGNIEVRNGKDREFSRFEFDHRSIYLPLVRNAEPELLVTFDLPDTELSVGDRSVTTVPAQSLFLLNSPWVIKNAQALTARVFAHKNTDVDARIDYAYQLALARSPRPEETANLRSYLSSSTSTASADSEQRQAWVRACQAIFASTEFRYVE
jgi:hypothetical protein